MKLIIAIVQDKDSSKLSNALVEADIRATKLSTTGGFLRAGNTTFLIGVEEDKIETVIIKSVGVAYVTQFAAEILRDSGENAIASKVESGGKICILAFAMPVMTSFLELCTRVVNGL